MTQNKLNEILAKHTSWLRGEESGERADLTFADLTGPTPAVQTPAEGAAE